MNRAPAAERAFYPGLDGIRALCFLLVFLFHCGINGFQLGWGGVTMFFAISGFLITDILIKAKGSKSYFKRFYMRRTLRIVPIYLLLLASATLLTVFMRGMLFRDLPYLLTYTQNFFWTFSAYRSDLHTLMTHTWSLAIEEQFYLLWPLLVWLVPNRHLGRLCLAVIGLGMLFRVIAIPLNLAGFPTWILLFAQMDALALGALLACHRLDLGTPRWARAVLDHAMLIGLAGIGAIVLELGLRFHRTPLRAYALFESAQGYVNQPATAQIYLFLALIAVGLILGCLRSQGGGTYQVLSGKYLVHLGKISYGLYVYHWPIVFALQRIVKNKFILTSLALLLTYGVAVISFHTIEKYFNGMKARFEYGHE